MYPKTVQNESPIDSIRLQQEVSKLLAANFNAKYL